MHNSISITYINRQMCTHTHTHQLVVQQSWSQHFLPSFVCARVRVWMW